MPQIQQLPKTMRYPGDYPEFCFSKRQEDAYHPDPSLRGSRRAGTSGGTFVGLGEDRKRPPDENAVAIACPLCAKSRHCRNAEKICNHPDVTNPPVFSPAGPKLNRCKMSVGYHPKLNGPTPTRGPP